MSQTFLNGMVQMQSAALAESQRNLQRWASVPRVIEQARTTRVGITPHEVVWHDGAIRLLKYRRETPAALVEPVVFCYALVNRPYILDLQPGRSVVEQYLHRGFDVYLIDWGVPSPLDAHRGLDDYVAGTLRRVMRFVSRLHGVARLNLLGYCMGGTMATLYTAAFPETVRNLTLMAAPIDFAGRESLLHLWTDAKNFDVDALIDTYGNCPGEFLQGCFLMMKPVQNLFEKYVTFYEQMDDPKFVENYFAMERWVGDNIPVAGATFREFVQKLYQGNQLVKGEFHLGHRRINLKAITCPLLLLTADNDHLVAPESTLNIQPLVGSTDVKSLPIAAGHVGLAVSSKAHKAYWPEATAWLADRSTTVVR